MPNWTNNRLTITHKDKDVMDSLMAQVRATDTLFNVIHPMPENTFHGNLGSDEREMCQREGRPNWYDWCNENWTTKWDACQLSYNQHDDNSVSFDFDTAWCAPYGVYEALAEQGFEVEAYYVSFENWDAGEWHYDPENPTSMHDVHINDIDDGVTPDIDEAFDVTRQVQEYKDEVERMNDDA